MSLIHTSTSDDTVVTMDQFYEEYTEQQAMLMSGRSLGYKTGIPILDTNCRGLQPGTVTRLTAYSNIGKTRLTAWIMSNLLKQGIKCAFFSLEVRSDKFFPILASCLMSCNSRDIEDGKVQVDWDYINSMPLAFYHDKDRLTDIIMMAKKQNAKAVFIDFCQNVDAGYLGEEYKNMTHYAREIQRFAVQNNVAVFDLSQLSNEAAKSGADAKIVASK